jgi:hypothetical protein
MAPATLARFSYLEGDPVNRFDPSGAAGFEWEAGKMTLEGVCDLFQKGKVEASYAFGNTQDSFGYQGAIEKRGWAYDVWSKKVPGTNRVVTIIRDLNEKASGPYGKTNINGNLVLGARPDNLPVARHLPATPPAAEGGGLMQRVKDLATQAKHGVQLYGKEVATTVGVLGGVSGTLGSEVALILSLPGGVGIVAVAVGAAGVVGYGAGTLLNKIPFVANAAEKLIGGAMGFEADQMLANSKAELEQMGERAKEIKAQQMKDFQAKVAASGLPSEMPEPGVAGGTADLGAIPGPPETQPVGGSTASVPAEVQPPPPGNEEPAVDPSGAPEARPAEGPGSTSPSRRDTRPTAASDEAPANPDEDDEEEREVGDEEDDPDGSDEEDDRDEPQPPSNEQPRILDLVSPVRITVSYGMENDASHGRFKNVVTCKGTMTFWNVGTMAPGFGDASFTARCVASINGSETNESGRGTFSGGPNGTVTFVTDGMTIRASLRGGTTLSISEVGTFPISPGGAFDNWPEKLP